MYKQGIIDPAKVTRSTLQNAASIASMVLTTECIIVDKMDKKLNNLPINLSKLSKNLFTLFILKLN